MTQTPSKSATRGKELPHNIDATSDKLRSFLATQKDGLNLYNEHLKQMEIVLERNTELEQRNRELEVSLASAMAKLKTAEAYREWIIQMAGSAHTLLGNPNIYPASTTESPGNNEDDIAELKEKLANYEKRMTEKDDLLYLTKDVLVMNRELLDSRKMEFEVMIEECEVVLKGEGEEDEKNNRLDSKDKLEDKLGFGVEKSRSAGWRRGGC